MVAAVTVTGEPPVLVTSIVCGGLIVPYGCPEKITESARSCVTGGGGVITTSGSSPDDAVPITPPGA
jgi:hypothetical protein